MRDRAQSPLTLVLVTGSYPYEIAMERTFLVREIEIIAEEFEHVVLVPESRGGIRYATPEGVEVDESLVDLFDSTSRSSLLARSLASRLWLEDVARRPSAVASYRTAKSLAHFCGRAALCRDWLTQWLERRRIERCVVCTYWWEASTTGFGLAKRNRSELRVASRAHGFDLYEERHDRGYLPCRRRSLAVLDGLFPDSAAGRSYLEGRYGRDVPVCCETARLGVPDPGGSSPPSKDGVWRVVSCSRIVPLKRIDLLLRGLAHAARERPSQRFHWRHFGTGELRDDVLRLAKNELPTNVEIDFPGYSSQEDLFAYYLSTPVDLFVNVSTTEGTPVAIMEAIAAGIPILATAVGGNVEITTAENGQTLPANPTAEEVARGILRGLDDPVRAAEWRQGSRAVFARHYDADKNFRSFAGRLRALLG